MVFGLLCTNCLHDTLVTKVKTQPWLRDSSTTQLQGGTPFTHAMGNQHLHMLETPICLLWVPCKHYKYHVLWLTQGLWHPNLAYPRLNITTKKRGLAEEVKVPVLVSVHPGPLTSFNTLVDYVLVTFGTVWPQPWATLSSPHLYRKGHSEPTVMSLSWGRTGNTCFVGFLAHS